MNYPFDTKKTYKGSMSLKNINDSEATQKVFIGSWGLTKVYIGFMVFKKDYKGSWDSKNSKMDPGQACQLSAFRAIYSAF